MHWPPPWSLTHSICTPTSWLKPCFTSHTRTRACSEPPLPHLSHPHTYWHKMALSKGHCTCQDSDIPNATNLSILLALAHTSIWPLLSWKPACLTAHFTPTTTLELSHLQIRKLSHRDIQQLPSVMWLIISREPGCPWPKVRAYSASCVTDPKFRRARSLIFTLDSNFKSLADIALPDSQAFGTLVVYVSRDTFLHGREKEGTYFCLTNKYVIPRTLHLF